MRKRNEKSTKNMKYSQEVYAKGNSNDLYICEILLILS